MAVVVSQLVVAVEILSALRGGEFTRGLGPCADPAHAALCIVRFACRALATPKVLYHTARVGSHTTRVATSPRERGF